LALNPDRPADYVLPDDVKYIAPFVLAHRVLPAGRRVAREVIRRIVDSVAVP
jgi:MoxR-like ATPase